MSELNLFIFGCVVSFIVGYAYVQDLFARRYYRDNATAEQGLRESKRGHSGPVEPGVRGVA